MFGFICIRLKRSTFQVKFKFQFYKQRRIVGCVVIKKMDLSSTVFFNPSDSDFSTTHSQLTPADEVGDGRTRY